MRRLVGALLVLLVVGIARPSTAQFGAASRPGAVTTATVAQVTATTISTTLLASSLTRRWWRVCNASSSPLLLLYGATASPTNYTRQLPAGQCFEPEASAVYVGRLDGVWAAPMGVDGYALVTDIP